MLLPALLPCLFPFGDVVDQHHHQESIEAMHNVDEELIHDRDAFFDFNNSFLIGNVLVNLEGSASYEANCNLQYVQNDYKDYPKLEAWTNLGCGFLFFLNKIKGVLVEDP